MATYSNIGIKLITTGDESGTWGTSTNTNFSDVLDEAIAGAVTYNISSDADFTLTVSDGTSSDARHAVIKFTSTTLSATRTCTFAPNDLQKTWVVINATTGGQSLTFKQGSAGATVTVPNGESAIIYSDGGGASAGAITRVLDSFTNTKITTGTLNATTLDLTNLEVTNIKAKDGTAAASIADSTGIVSLSANPILSGGTANGVLYLNGSKVATSGSALYFDGTNLGVGTTSPTAVDGNTNTKLTVGDGSTNDGALGAVTVQRKATSTSQGVGIFQFANTQISATEKRIAFIQGATGSATNSGTLSFWTANAGTLAEAGRFDSSGNLGIGTASPTHRLTIGSGSYTQAAASSTTGMYTTATGLEMLSDSYYFGNRSGTNLAFLNSSGNLGLGVTPSAWSLFKALQIGTSYGALNFSGTGSSILTNAYYDGTNYKYQNTGGGAGVFEFSVSSGNSFVWRVAGNGTAGNNITLTSAMTLNSSSQLGIGYNNPAYKLDISEAGNTQAINIRDSSSSNFSVFGITPGTYNGGTNKIETINTTNLNIVTNGSTYIAFGTNATERARITSAGDFGIGTTTPGTRLNVTFSNATTYSATNAATWASGLIINNAVTAATNVSNLINFQGASNVNAAFGVVQNASGFGDFIWASYNGSFAERARITAGGNLLVGTTTDVSGLSGVISDVSGNVRAIPQSGSDKTTSYTLVKSDVGKFIGVGASGSITVPDATFATGDVVSIFNNTTGNVTLTMTITTAYIGGTNTDKATITLATRGVATILFISGTVCVVNGNVS